MELDDVCRLPIAQRIDWLFELADRHSEDFVGPESQLARTRYMAQHPTAIMAFKCMDGRINLPAMTETPHGVVQPFRNLGGIFDLGWPHLGEVLADHVHGIARGGRQALAILSYHFSRGDPARGCAGFNYDTEAAKEHTFALRKQMEQVFGTGRGTVYPLVCGIETDEDALILHGNDGGVLEVASLDAARLRAASVRERLAALYPDMDTQRINDLLPMVEGNRRHVERMRGVARALAVEHREWAVCLGRGFDFLNVPNLALVIGPYSPDLGEPVRKAAGIIRANMSAGRIPEDGFLLLASAPYLEPGVDRARARLKAGFLSRFAADVIREVQPELAGKMHVQTAIMDWRARRLELQNPQRALS